MTDQPGWGPPQQPPWEQSQQPSGGTQQYHGQPQQGSSYATPTSPPGYQPPPQLAPPWRPGKQRGRATKIVGAVVYSIVVLLIGVAIGSATASKTGTPAAASTPATSATTSPAPASTTSSAPAAAASAKHVLIRFAGSGIKNSAPFDVGSGPLTVTYRFNCAAFGSSGNFVADLLYGNQSSLSGDDQSIANDLAASGGQTTTVYPQDPGKDYYLSVNSECSWRLKVVSG
jgi:hypothetical protein